MAEDIGEDTLALWETLWQDGKKWQDWDGYSHDSAQQVKKFFLDHIEKMTEGRTGLKFLVPCCGQALEMKWLADQGHEIVGIEGVRMTCENFYKHENLKYSVSDIHEIPGGKLFKGENCNVQIYNSDIFELNEGILGHFDAIIDRGAFVVINFADRSRYTTLMRSVVKPKCKILLVVPEYDWNERSIKGSPRPASKNDVVKFYGKWCTIEEIGREDMLNGHDRDRNKGTWGSVLTSHFSVQYLLQVVQASTAVMG